MHKSPKYPIHGYGWRGPYWIQDAWCADGPVRWRTICRYAEREIRRWLSAGKTERWIYNRIKDRNYLGYEPEILIGGASE